MDLRVRHLRSRYSVPPGLEEAEVLRGELDAVARGPMPEALARHLAAILAARGLGPEARVFLRRARVRVRLRDRRTSPAVLAAAWAKAVATRIEAALEPYADAPPHLPYVDEDVAVFASRTALYEHALALRAAGAQAAWWWASAMGDPTLPSAGELLAVLLDHDPAGFPHRVLALAAATDLPRVLEAHDASRLVSAWIRARRAIGSWSWGEAAVPGEAPGGSIEPRLVSTLPPPTARLQQTLGRCPELAELLVAAYLATTVPAQPLDRGALAMRARRWSTAATASEPPAPSIPGPTTTARQKPAAPAARAGAAATSPRSRVVGAPDLALPPRADPGSEAKSPRSPRASGDPPRGSSASLIEAAPETASRGREDRVAPGAPGYAPSPDTTQARHGRAVPSLEAGPTVHPRHTVSAADDRATLDRAVYDVRCGGLLFLLRPLQRHSLVRRHHGAALHTRLLAFGESVLDEVLAPLPRDRRERALRREEVLLSAFSGLDVRPWEPGEAPRFAEADEALSELRAALPPASLSERALRATFGGVDVAFASEATRALATVVLRPARLMVEGPRYDLHFAADLLDPELRRRGWDVDPGWVPFLGRVIRFHYVAVPEHST
ncbi:MAG: hypothetical protein KC619_23955 [Myxococcales bacterium]|nr:hypothetical protein [Myxococcales bacterium]